MERAGGVEDVAAIAVAGQQHGMVCLDESGDVVRDALLWNDTRSAQAAADLVEELDGGAQALGRRGGIRAGRVVHGHEAALVRRAEPDRAARTAAVCLPHDWLTWQLAGAPGLDALCTDRGDASGTGYWSPAPDAYRTDLLELAFGATPHAAARARRLPSAGADRVRCGARRRDGRQRRLRHWVWAPNTVT